MNISPKQFYTSQLKQHEQDLAVAKRKLNLSSTLRLLVFVAITFIIYFLWGNLRAVIPAAIIGIAIFLFLVTRHTKLKYKKNISQALIDYNTRELRVLDRDFHDLPEGTEYNDPLHAYCQDIDLFGLGSFFQYLNRTAVASGTDELASLFLSNDITQIANKQEAIKELSTLALWRQQFYAKASLIKTEVPVTQVSQWLETYSSFMPSFSKGLSYGFSGVTILGFIAYYFQFIPGIVVFGLFVLGLLISAKFMGSIGALSSKVSKVQSTFDQYAKLISSIEEQEMESVLLSRKRNLIINKQAATSGKLKEFSKLLDALDQRNNIIVAVLVNGLFLRDIIIAYKIEKWIEAHQDEVSVWFETIAFFDAYNSLGNFGFNHPSYSYPEILTQGKVLESTKARHPLLDPEVAVPSDIVIDSSQFFIVTGANMAGKSTFLRAVSLQIVMGNLGLPLAAEKVKYQPIKLITSMRTTDSLADDESYFFSELKRLKFIVDEIKKDRYFIILDEILKGTNSTDKAIGSRKFVDKLVASQSTGIIATHDLSLTKAAQELAPVENYFFDARIVKDELFFDYSLKKGVCENMNASFLLKKMEIVD
jgi:ABC-type multidrug transport system fused ATPase/permease subunit